MGSLCNESFEEFLSSLKAAGVAISNEAALRERLAEAHVWRYAFLTLAANGRSIGIRFSEEETGSDEQRICSAFAKHQFPAEYESRFLANFKSQH